MPTFLKRLYQDLLTLGESYTKTSGIFNRIFVSSWIFPIEDLFELFNIVDESTYVFYLQKKLTDSEFGNQSFCQLQVLFPKLYVKVNNMSKCMLGSKYCTYF